jgi:uncharacterized membrane protein
MQRTKGQGKSVQHGNRFWRIHRVRLQGLVDRSQESLFLVPALYVVGAVVLASLLLTLDARLGSTQEPVFLRTTVANARALLSTIAGAVITVTGLTLGLVVITLQLASSQFSPRVLRSFYRSHFQQAVIGFTMGTFTYCLLVLRVVRAPLEQGGDAVVPGLSVAVAVVLGVVATLAILAYVNYIGHAMRVGNLIEHVANETVAGIHHLPLHQIGDVSLDSTQEPRPEGSGSVVRADRSSWVQQAPSQALLAAIPAGSMVRLDVRVGVFVSASRPLCTVWPVPEELTRVQRLLHEAIQLGPARTMQEDLAFGIRQLSDIALRALSPAVNDPTTAYEVIVHLGAIVRELLRRDLPPITICGEEGRWLMRPHEFTHADYVNRAFDQIRQAGVSQTALAITLLETVGMLISEVDASGLAERAAPLRKQAHLILAGCKAASPLPEDLEQVYDAARKAGIQLESDGGICPLCAQVLCPCLGRSMPDVSLRETKLS